METFHQGKATPNNKIRLLLFHLTATLDDLPAEKSAKSPRSYLLFRDAEACTNWGFRLE